MAVLDISPVALDPAQAALVRALQLEEVERVLHVTLSGPEQQFQVSLLRRTEEE